MFLAMSTPLNEPYIYHFEKAKKDPNERYARNYIYRVADCRGILAVGPSYLVSKLFRYQSAFPGYEWL